MRSQDLEFIFRKWKDIKYYFPYSELGNTPKWRTAILTCMDCRIISNIFCIDDPGEVIIIRNAGSLLTFDSLRSLLIAVYELEVETIIVVGHTDCGGCMTPPRMNQIIVNISERTNRSPDEILKILNVQTAEEAFLGFTNVENQINETVANIKNHPLFSGIGVEVQGYIYNTKTGEMIKQVDKV